MLFLFAFKYFLYFVHTVGVLEKLPLPLCNYRSNGGKAVNGVLFAARRSNVERVRRLNVCALVNVF